MKTKNAILRTLLIVVLIFMVNTSFLAENKTNFINNEETEESLEIEDWMLNNFNVNATIETETEESLQVEDWMMNNFNVNTFEVETEKPLKVENWMLDEKNFQ